MFFVQIVTVLILFNIISSEIIIEQHTFCNVEIFFKKFLVSQQLKCIRIDNEHPSELATISRCLWNYFEEIAKVPFNQHCKNQIYIGANNTLFDENYFSPFTNILLINPAFPELLNIPSLFLKSLNIFLIQMETVEKHLRVLPKLHSLIDNETYDWITSGKNFLSQQSFTKVLLRNDLNI